MIYRPSKHPRFALIHYPLAARTPSYPLKRLRVRTAIRPDEASARPERERILTRLLDIATQITQIEGCIPTGDLARRPLRASHAALVGICGTAHEVLLESWPGLYDIASELMRARCQRSHHGRNALIMRGLHLRSYPVRIERTLLQVRQRRCW